MEDYSLFELEKDYYLGNYQTCINKANSMPSAKETTFYMCLSYFHLKKYDFLSLETSKSDENCIKMIALLTDYTTNPNRRGAIVNKLNDMLSNKEIEPKDDLSRLVASTIFVQEKMYSDGLRILHGLDSLAVTYATIGILLLMNRNDLAEKRLASMQSKDDYATLTQLALAQVRLASGNAKETQDIALELEEKYKATPLLKNLQAAAAISLGNHDLAKQHCESALDMDNDNLEALINMIYILSKTKAPNELRERNLGRFKALYPDHEYVKEFERLDMELIVGE